MLVLVRHGEATANAAGLLLGRTDAPLTEKGRAQVAALRRRLGPVTRLVSSPLSRALDTAAGLGLGLPVEIDERWIEIDYGEHEGQAIAGPPVGVWRTWRSDPSYCPASGESLTDVAARVGAACAELFSAAGAGARADGADVVVVSHVSPIKAAVGWALGMGAEAAWRLHLSTGSVTRIGWTEGAPVVHAFNWVPEWAPGRAGGGEGHRP